MNTISMNDADNIDAGIEPQARAWLVRLRSGQATSEDAQAFRQWCAANPAHARAAAKIGYTWKALESAAARVAAEESHAGRRGSGYQSVNHGRRAFVGLAVAASASWLVFRPPLQLWPALSDFVADYRTGTGQQRQLALSERVVIDMNTQTRMNLLPASAGPPGAHGIELLAGEAEVVASAPATGRTTSLHPVVVVAGRGRLQTQVGRFNVRRIDDQVCVTCVSGTVAFEHPLQHVDLLASQQLTYDDRSVQPAVQVDPSTVTAWRRGMLIFNDVPLADAIDEINRYRPGKLILRNAELGGRRVHAKLFIDKLDRVVEMIHELYGARITRLPGNIVLLS